jgi:hypothetical protein
VHNDKSIITQQFTFIHDDLLMKNMRKLENSLIFSNPERLGISVCAERKTTARGSLSSSHRLHAAKKSEFLVLNMIAAVILLVYGFIGNLHVFNIVIAPCVACYCL